ncbi:MAG TPA: TylF/MycF/NovP-related O-methyltransferase [Thermoanaerobaculia bacterium]|nr:TylF/MycF/NovP-related O-methyltransferase [Thermoanaerobaculia bacterium]
MSDLRTVQFSERHKVSFKDAPVPDIDRDARFLELFEIARPFTMTGKDAMFALYGAVNHILDRGIPGDFVECGVWRGGSSLLVSLILKARGVRDRKVLLYDTFTGMTPPSEMDVDYKGNTAAGMMAENADGRGWCYAPLEELKSNFARHELPFETAFIEGDVAETLKGPKPERIALLRLDTDWYESTLAELVHLYPRLSPGGVLIIDDYGHWEGARRATDDYFATVPPPLLVRVNYSVRLAVKG